MLISCAVTAQLICAFVFAYAKSRFSHDVAHIQKCTSVTLHAHVIQTSSKHHFYKSNTEVYRGVHYCPYVCSKTYIPTNYVLSKTKTNITFFCLKTVSICHQSLYLVASFLLQKTNIHIFLFLFHSKSRNSRNILEKK